MPNDIPLHNDTIPVLQAVGADGNVHNVKCDNNGYLVTTANNGSTVPASAVLVYNSGTAAAAAALTVSLPAVAAKTNFITGFDLAYGQSTAQVTSTVTITGISTTLSYIVDQPTGTASPWSNISIRFPTPIPSSAVNTAINVVVPAATGGGAPSVNVYGLNG